MFFDFFPKMIIKTDTDSKESVNILVSFFLRRIEIDRAILFQKYRISDGERPEHVADKLYGRPEYHWTILLLNDIIDPYSDWMIPQKSLDRYIEEKYKNGILIGVDKNNNPIYKFLSSGLEGIHHFIDSSTLEEFDEYDDYLKRIQYHNDPQSIGNNIIPITNLIYESEENMKKMEIDVINPIYISKFVEDFKKILQ